MTRFAYRITVWEKGSIDTANGEYWVRHDTSRLTRRDALLLKRFASGVGFRGDWCPNRMRLVNGRLVAVELLERGDK